MCTTGQATPATATVRQRTARRSWAAPRPREGVSGTNSPHRLMIAPAAGIDTIQRTGRDVDRVEAVGHVAGSLGAGT
jgi:hypothetical protein